MAPTDTSSSTSESLINRVRSLDPDAWRRLSELYGPVVYDWARQKGLQADDASDIVQEVFRTVADRIATFRRDRPGDSFRGWLWGITRNKLKEHYRRSAQNPAGAGGAEALEELQLWADAGTDEPDERQSGSRSDIMRRTLEYLRNEFEETTCQCFLRMVVHREPAREIANDLGMSAESVRRAKFRVLRRLRQELDDLL